MARQLHITSKLDSGNIRVVSADDPSNVQLQILPEPYTPYDKVSHYQWFHFRIVGAKGVPLTLRITNAGHSSFPEAWPGYQACAAYTLSPEAWFRVATTYDPKSGELVLKHTPERDSVFFSYFPPYSYDRHLQLVSDIQARRPDLVSHRVLGSSVQGRPIDVLTITSPNQVEAARSKAVLWIIARQHPGESMAEWWADGFLHSIRDPQNENATALINNAIVHVVPNTNPDGSVMGHLRTNALGANLNREWINPNVNYAPEVVAILSEMDKTGCDAFLDVHGDEEATYVFMDGDEGVPSFGKKIAEQESIFRQALMAKTSPDFQPTDFYGITPPGKAEMGIAANAIGERFKCFSVTLEMPFKDTAQNPDRLRGWTAGRSIDYGRHCLEPLRKLVDRIVEEAIGNGATEPQAKKTKLG